MKEQTVQEAYDFVSSKRQIPESKFECVFHIPPTTHFDEKQDVEEASLMGSAVL